MSYTPKITIVTVCYNAEQTIEATIQSVLGQTYLNLEYVIVDGRSTDQTTSIIKKYQHKIATYVSEKDKGIYDAMNKALALATGDYIYFLGADDLLMTPTTISDCVVYFSKPDVSYYGNVLFKSQNQEYNFKLSKWTLCLRNISHQSIFYAKAYYKNNQYNLRYKIFADHIYNIKMYAQVPEKIVHIPEVVALYNDNGASSHSYDVHYFNELPKVVYQYLGFPYATYVWLRLTVFKLKRSIK